MVLPTPTHNSFDAGYLPISSATFAPSSAVGVDIYVQNGPRYILFCSSEDQLSAEQFLRITQAGQTKLFIRSEDRAAYQNYLQSNWETIVESEHIVSATAAPILCEVVRDLLAFQFASGNTESIVQACQTLGVQTARLFDDKLMPVQELYQVLHHDYGTFTHSANVSVYATLLARRLSFSESDLAEIATGALLHDLGKLDIDDRILNKPGKLTDEEFRIIKEHPTRGLERVASRPDLTEGQAMMIYQHHERCNGAGYPVGCDHNEIHPWAKICAIVDVFEAVTALRPYRSPLSFEAAQAILDRGDGTEFDREMLGCWRELIGKE